MEIRGFSILELWISKLAVPRCLYRAQLVPDDL
jgi:hypothetical protein